MCGMRKRRGISEVERTYIKRAWDNSCAYCRDANGPFVVDHIIPFSKGGSCDLENLCLSCQKCNSQKSDDRLPTFYEGLLLAKAKKKAKKVRESLSNKTRVNRSQLDRDTVRRVETYTSKEALKIVSTFLSQSVVEEAPYDFAPDVFRTGLTCSEEEFVNIFGVGSREAINYLAGSVRYTFDSQGVKIENVFMPSSTLVKKGELITLTLDRSIKELNELMQELKYNETR